MSSDLIFGLVSLWYTIGLLGGSIGLRKMNKGKAFGAGECILCMIMALWGLIGLLTAIFLITPDGHLKPIED